MTDRDDLAELIGSARNVTKCQSFYFTGRIRYGTKGEKVEERLLCMDAIRVYICSVKMPVKIESQFNILSIKLLERISDSHVIIEVDEKQVHSLYGLHDKSSLQPFLIVLIRALHAVFPHPLQAIVEFRPENEYDRLLRLSNEYLDEKLSSETRPCGGFSLRYACACDFYQIPFHRSVQNIVDTVFAHRTSREFHFREFESLIQKDWLPLIGALRHNDWFTKLSIENIKLASENAEELCTVVRLCKKIRDIRLIGCGLRHDFCTRLAHSLPVSHLEHIDLSNNALEDKGLIALSSTLQQRKLPILSINFQSCSLTHKSLHIFNTALLNNNILIKNLLVLNLSGNRIKDENCITLLFSNSENVLEELHLSDIEFSLESFFHSLATISVSCKLRRLFIYSIKSSVPSPITGGVKLFFAKIHSLEILQLANANLSVDFLRELCDGLHSNVHLDKLDLRLAGNQLESFVHEHAPRFAAISSLTALDITGCELDNEVPTLLNELKKNRKLKSLHLGRNFNNIKPKNMQRTIMAMRDLVLESNLEYLSIAESRLKEHTADFLLTFMSNTPLRTLDIRGNFMGDIGARTLSHVLQMNRHLHTIFFDRNLLSLTGFEEIVNALEENYVVQYLPIPVTDIVLMKASEKERLEKIPMLLNKLDSICMRNQQQQQVETVPSADSLLVTTAAHLTREMNSCWDNQQQLIGDQSSFDYVTSCSNRTNPNNNNPTSNSDLQSILTRTARLGKISSQLYETYIDEEKRLEQEWNDMCSKFQQKFAEKNERLSRKFYQLFKEQTTINYDDKCQEQIRTFFANATENTDRLLNKEMPTRLAACSRECYVNVVTCLQKRAYDATNDLAADMHKQMESAIFHSTASQPTPVGDGYASPSTIDRLVSRGNGVINRLANKLPHHPTEPTPTNVDETPASAHRQLKKADSAESVADPTGKTGRSATRPSNDKDARLLTASQTKGPTPPAPLSPKPPAWRKSVLVGSGEPEPAPPAGEPIYGNVSANLRAKKKETTADNEGDLIEHDLLDLVAQEQQKEEQQQQQQQQHRGTPPALPAKKKTATSSNLDIDLEPTSKLIHVGKDRPRRANVQRPVKRATNGGTTGNDSSSDGGLLTDENEDNSIGDTGPLPSSETQVQPTVDPITAELPPKTVTKIFKSALKTSKTASNEESPPSLIKNQPSQPLLQTRPSLSGQQQQNTTPPPATTAMSKSMMLINSDASTPPPYSSTGNFDVPPHDPLQTKPSMSTSSYATLMTTNSNEQKEGVNSLETAMAPVPMVLARTGKAAIGPRVLPVLDPAGEAPPVKLRHIPAEKKVSLADNSNATDATIATGESSLSPSNTNEQYKRLSVKERARMLTTTAPTTTAPLSSTNDKKPTANSPTVASQTPPPYTPRTYRRLIEQVNLFC